MQPSVDDPEIHDEREQILCGVESGAAEVVALSRWMTENPEAGLEERETHRRFVDFLDARGFKIERGVAGMATSFVARWGSDAAPCTLALLVEMDAIPDLGHAAGRNVSGPAALLAASALTGSMPPSELQLLAVGCPAAEAGVGKKRMVDAGVFGGVGAALAVEASAARCVHRALPGCARYEFVFHAAAIRPSGTGGDACSALDGVLGLFSGLGLLRARLAPGVRVDGIVSDGGRLPSVVPERAAARVWIRAQDPDEIERAVDRAIACARGAAEQSGTRLEIVQERGGAPPGRANDPLAEAWRRQLDRLGLVETAAAGGRSDAIGSGDISHVSRAVPTLHASVPVGVGRVPHTRAFADAAAGPEGGEALLEAARLLALTAHELVRSGPLRAAVAAAHASA